MPSTAWLPPLSHYEDRCQQVTSTTSVQISQTEHFQSDDSQPDGFIIMSFEASVDFVSDSADSNEDILKMQRRFRGYEIKTCLRSPNPELLWENITKIFPYFEKRVAWTEKRLNKVFKYKSCKHQDLFDSMRGFLDETKSMQSYRLIINKIIKIPDKQLKLLHSWYAVMDAKDAGFTKEWRNNISRLRTEEERKNEARVPGVPWFEMVEFDKVNGSESSCPICFNEFSAGSRAVKLPCGHIFDEMCITKWLTYEGPSERCPVCRSDIHS